MQPEPVDLEALVREAVSVEVSFPVFTVVVKARRAGLALDERTVAAIAAGLDRAPDQVDRVARFVTDLLVSGQATPAYRCVSVSCTMNGAVALGKILDECALETAPCEVHCLDQCESGPSLQVGDSIYVGTLDDVIADERPWRDGPIPTA